MLQAKWNNRINEYNGSFLQSWEWGEFQQAYGRRIERITTDNHLVQCIFHSLPAGRKFIFSPYGPVGSNKADINELVDKVLQKANQNKAVFWRYENFGKELAGQLVKSIHPEYTWILPLQDTTSMMENMKSKWRYNIKLAERKGVTVRVSTSLKDLDNLYKLLQATAKRQSINIYPKSYYQLMLDHLGRANMLKLYLAEYENKVIAANIMIGFGNLMTYVHGGNDYEHRALMAPHLLQWQAIKDAQAAGFKEYDFFGIAPPDQSSHPWTGITRFKKGFGGYMKQHPGTYDMALNSIWYNAYKLAKKIKK